MVTKSNKSILMYRLDNLQNIKTKQKKKRTCVAQYKTIKLVQY